MSSSNQVVVPAEFRKHYDIAAGDEISWTNTEEGILLKIEKKVTEEDIIGLIKNELRYNSVEIKKEGQKDWNGDNLIFVDATYIIALIVEKRPVAQRCS